MDFVDAIPLARTRGMSRGFGERKPQWPTAATVLAQQPGCTTGMKQFAGSRRALLMLGDRPDSK